MYIYIYITSWDIQAHLTPSKNPPKISSSTSSWAKHAEASIWSSFSLLPTSQPGIGLGCGRFTHPPKKRPKSFFLETTWWLGRKLNWSFFFWRFLSFKGFWEKETQRKSVAAFSNHAERNCCIFSQCGVPKIFMLHLHTWFPYIYIISYITSLTYMMLPVFFKGFLRLYETSFIPVLDRINHLELN